MMEDKIKAALYTQSLDTIFEQFPDARDLFMNLRLEELDWSLPLLEAIEGVSEQYLEDFGMDRESLVMAFCHYMELEGLNRPVDIELESITILGGTDKAGQKEIASLMVTKGQVVSIVGPTGAGKTRLLDDIECLAQRDTPTGRGILLNGKQPEETLRFSAENRLVAQLSQNMHFIMDLSVEEFIALHAESRGETEPGRLVEKVIEKANTLTGEPFDGQTALTQLSGGQSRALMIADIAMVSVSPIVLIDELENAGVDHRRAIKLLVGQDKIVFMSTHNPMLAMSGDLRIVIQNGGIRKVIQSGPQEQKNAALLSQIDRKMTALRNRIRQGDKIEFDLSSYF